MRTLELEDKVVLVTGAAGGIGAAVVRALHARGARVVITDLSQEAVDRLAGEMNPARVLGRALDVTDLNATREIAEQAVTRFGQLDVVLANAGISPGGAAPLWTMDSVRFEQVVEVDLLGVWRTIKACLPHVRATRGHVLITSSIYAFTNGVLNAPYAVSKAGVEMLGRALRAELAGTGATAGVLYPGWITTPMTVPVFDTPGITRDLVRHVFPRPLRSPLDPAEVAKAAVDGIERRRARVIVPKRWVPISLLRGVASALTDRWLDVDTTMHAMLRRAEQPSTVETNDFPRPRGMFASSWRRPFGWTS